MFLVIAVHLHSDSDWTINSKVQKNCLYYVSTCLLYLRYWLIQYTCIIFSVFSLTTVRTPSPVALLVQMSPAQRSVRALYTHVFFSFFLIKVQAVWRHFTIYRRARLRIISATCSVRSPSSNRAHPTPSTHVHKRTCPRPFQSISSACIYLHLTPQIALSICLRVWLHVCRLQRCASFDLNSYPTAHYRGCCSYSTDCSRLRNRNVSRSQTPGALSF